jgi:hypothetical protein
MPSRVQRRQAASIPSARVAPTATDETPVASATAFESALIAPALEVLPLEGRRLDPSDAALAPGLAQPPALQTTGSAVRDAPWIRAAEAGVDIGERAKRSGIVIGDFFNRASRKLASSFTEPPAP